MREFNRTGLFRCRFVSNWTVPCGSRICVCDCRRRTSCHMLRHVIWSVPDRTLGNDVLRGNVQHRR